MGGKGSGKGHKHSYDFEAAVKYYAETLCENKVLRQMFGISSHQATDVMTVAIDKLKFRTRMEKMIIAGAEYNPEIELERI